MADEELQTNRTTDSGIAGTTAALNGLSLRDRKGNLDTPSALEALALPQSSKDGVVKKPLSAPLPSAQPTTRPPLSTEQHSKYDTLLAKVVPWTEVPESSARGAKSTPLKDNERMFLTRECLLRYLRATKWNVAEAETKLRNTLVWRREYGIEKLTPEYIGIENATGKQLIMGWDINGRPCQYMMPSKQNTERTPRQIQHLVFMTERSVDMMPPGQETLVLLINFAETKAGQGASVAQGRESLNILQNHYPERLGRALITNVPWFISGFFKIIGPFIDPVTREKIKFNEDLRTHVPPTQLLKESGGDLEVQYDHEQYWPTLNKICEIKREAMRTRWEKGGKRIGESEVYLRGGDERSLAETEAGTQQNGSVEAVDTAAAPANN